SPAFHLRRRVAELEAARRALPRPEGRHRESSVAGVYEDCLRHIDRSYTRLHELSLEPTVLSADPVDERRCDDSARMLVCLWEGRYCWRIPSPAISIASNQGIQAGLLNEPPAV